MFDGTMATGAAAIVALGPQIYRTPTKDFNSKPEVAEGLYLSGSLITAAQFPCHECQRGSPDQVDVLEFIWHDSSAVHEFADQADDWLDVRTVGTVYPQAAEIFKNDVVSGYVWTTLMRCRTLMAVVDRWMAQMVPCPVHSAVQFIDCYVHLDLMDEFF
ncbi:hypothetical protein FB451DRAFT_124280 [Mycena latifolia]|nr:hypothetical protein FB451DRAFT_124280 [Mycena latifolia]